MSWRGFWLAMSAAFYAAGIILAAIRGDVATLLLAAAIGALIFTQVSEDRR